MQFNFFRYKIFFIFLFIGLLGCSGETKSVSENTNNYKDAVKKNKQPQIILYMTDAEDSGQIITNKNKAKYYRELLKQEGNSKYLVQDFYISGAKQTDPYWLVNGKKNYVFNESNHQKYYPREGKRIIWYESGNKLAITNYSNNIENGIWKTWYENGNLKEEMTYKNGQLDGFFKNWSENGILLGECYYHLGKENGRCYEKYTIKPEVFIYNGNYREGKKIGVWKEWDLDGNLINSKKFN